MKQSKSDKIHTFFAEVFLVNTALVANILLLGLAMVVLSDSWSWIDSLICENIEWETLASGIMALLAAFGTIHHIRKQLQQAEDFKAQENERRIKELRIMLARDLQHLVRYTREVRDYVFELVLDSDRANNNKVIKNDFSIEPSILETLSKLGGCFSDDSDELKHVILLASNIQISSSRINTWCREEPNTTHHYDSKTLTSLQLILMELTILEALYGGFFQYARFQKNTFGAMKTKEDCHNEINRVIDNLEYYISPLRKSYENGMKGALPEPLAGFFKTWRKQMENGDYIGKELYKRMRDGRRHS